MLIERKYKEAVAHLTKGNVLLCPTDTIWGISCDATNNSAIQRIKTLKERPGDKSFIVLMANETMLMDYLEKSIHPTALELLHRADRPTTIIFPNLKGISSEALANDGSLGIRIPQVEWLQEVITQFGKPIVSTSANISGQPSPSTFEDINTRIVHGVDFVLPTFLEQRDVAPSRIMKVEADGSMTRIRE
ncbi:MAG: Sua5/YciO/YrdC/YwlC family protein [Saprospiraceae bacterium]|nr:Sua5/YciO/YrdC/YwlC family protein [Saprospiraceae bacterium]